MRLNNFINREGLKLLSVFSVMVFFAFIANPANAQAQYKYDYEWLFGYNAYPDGINPYKRFAINLVSFHSNPPDTIRTPLHGSTGVSATVSIADSEGEVLFYSNGCRLFNSDGSMVEGGEVLLSGPTFENFCYIDENIRYEDYPSWIQSRFILPMDKSDSLFFFLYQRSEWTHNTDFDSPFPVVNFDLHLSRIEVGDNGYVMESSQVILDQMFAIGNMQAVRSEKENHWWIIVPPAVELKNYEVIHLGPMGVDTIVTFFADYSGTPLEGKWIMSNGSAAMSPKGNRFVWWDPSDTTGTVVLDFDRTTGQLSNLRHLPHPERDNYVPSLSTGGGGAAISPNGRFLYINTLTNLYQYDLHSEDIAATKVHIAEFDDFVDPGNNLPTYFFMQQLAPDCRIYMSSPNTVRYLHVINHPNRKGKSCDFQQHSFKLPGNHQFGLPYHPNYRLGTDYPVCDSTLTSTWFVPEEPEGQLHLYPNPARDYAVVGWTEMNPVEVALYDLTGRLLLQDRIAAGSPEYYLRLDQYSPGMYLIRLRDREGRYVTERLVVKR
jgi:hypothetical protein